MSKEILIMIVSYGHIIRKMNAIQFFIASTMIFLPLYTYANPFSVSGQVYDDVDQSQSLTAGDTGVSSVTIVLYDVANDSCQSISTEHLKKTLKV